MAVRKLKTEDQLNEAELSERIKRRIEARFPRAVVWKNWEGGRHDSWGRYINYAEPGRPDLMCVIEGRFYAMEIKRPDRRRYTSDKQKAWLDKLNSPHAGGPMCAAVICSVAEAIAFVTGGEEQQALFNISDQLRS